MHVSMYQASSASMLDIKMIKMIRESVGISIFTSPHSLNDQRANAIQALYIILNEGVKEMAVCNALWDYRGLVD